MHRRRRFLRVLSAAAGLALLPGSHPAQARLRHRWRGAALGAAARIDLWTEDRERAASLIRACLAEIDRLERIFSLHRADSALSLLNREGRLPRPPLELVTVLEVAARVSALSGGAFDVTVQPLWRLHAEHFARHGGDPAGPPARDLERLGRLVDHRALDVEPSLVLFARAGMAATLNGIAQGFIADRVADLLRDGGMASALVDVGEMRTVGIAPDGRGWQVEAGASGPVLDLERGAVATSSPAALAFDAGGRFGHLLDPATQRPASTAAEVTVVADSALVADALSTALAIRPHLAPPPGLGVRDVVRTTLPVS